MQNHLQIKEAHNNNCNDNTSGIMSITIVWSDFCIVHAGGGFGGKESRSTFLSSAIAVAAHKLVPHGCTHALFVEVT